MSKNIILTLGLFWCVASPAFGCILSGLQVLWIWRGWNFGARRCFVNVEVARQTLEKSAHESSSNDVILVFVLGCCCPGSCLATLTQKRSNNKPTSPLHQNLRTNLKSKNSWHKKSISLSHVAFYPLNTPLYGGLEFEWKCFRMSLEGGPWFLYSNVYNGESHTF